MDDAAAPTAPTETSLPAYGADAAGLIAGWRIDAAGRAEPIGSAAAARRLDAASVASAASVGSAAEPSAADGFVWLHFNLGHTGTRPWLAAHAGLPDEFVELLDAGAPSTRIERTDRWLIAVVNDVHFDFAFEPSDIATLWIAVEHDRVITTRRAPLRSVDRLRRAVQSGLAVRSPSELLEHLMRAQADTLVAIVRETTGRVDAIEDDLLTQRLGQRRVRLGRVRRLLVRLQRVLAPEPAALFRLLQHPPDWMGEADVQALRSATEEFSVVLRDMATLQERIKLLQEEIAAGVAEANNRSLFVLTIVTVLALPINLVAGLFGMNVGGVPLGQHPGGFWIVLGALGLVTGLGALVAFRKARRER